MHTNGKKHSWSLENTYKSLPAGFYSFQAAEPVRKPELVCFNESLAHDLGLGFLNHDEKAAAAYLSGNVVPAGAEPLAQAYAGHQFGYFTMLGDGRAILLGEQIDPEGHRFDIQLKGAGKTPYSRQGDGRATLYSMLREYLISESMHHLGIPTSRSLAVVAIGEQVIREDIHMGAVLTRVAASHIRVGTFEYAHRLGSFEDLKALTSYTIQRHYPELADTGNPALELLKAVMHKQIDLIVHWMRVGFIHGVMNTDNMSIAGETIDYGPCAFMNAFDPATVFSSIDAQGRYAFGNQPYIAQWNLSVFANALLPLISDNKEKAIELAQETMNGFRQMFSKKWYGMMFQKLGIMYPKEKDTRLVDELLSLMQANNADYTHVFRDLPEAEESPISLFEQKEFKQWQQKWEEALSRNPDKSVARDLMNRSNPRIIPRNHWVEDVLEAAVEGNPEPFHQLFELLKNPNKHHPEIAHFQDLPEGYDAAYQTFCGT